MMYFPRSISKLFTIFILVVWIAITVGIVNVKADGTAGSIPFSQNWTNTGLITTNDIWSGVPSIIGYRGDGLTSADGVDPQTILVEDSPGVVDVIANQINPNTNATGGVAEFDGIANPVIALQGSGTADAPYIKIFFDATGVNNVRVTYRVRDIDGSTDNAVQQVALQYRVGSSGNFTNIAAGYIADATTGPSLATLVNNIDVTLPAAVNYQPYVELRIMTTNAVGFDEWVGIDDIVITANHTPTGINLSPNLVLENQPASVLVGTLTAIDPDGSDTHTFALVTSVLCPGNGADNGNFSIAGNALHTAASFNFETRSSYSICVQVTDNHSFSTEEELTINILDIPDETPPSVSASDPANGSVLLTGPSEITVYFNEDVKHDSSVGAANNPVNFLLVAAGTDQTFETSTCSGGVALTDTQIAVNAAAYQSSGSLTTLTVNGGAPLGAGSYRLFVCGTTSIEDIVGNKLNNGLSDTLLNFTISEVLANSDARLPATGFPMGHVTDLPIQPADKTYASFSDLWLEIPKLTLSTPIVGVPLTQNGWDVSWLDKNAGWLNETAFPTWAGNSVITAHVWDSYNQPGTFYNLKNLQYGDSVKVHAFGQVYTYEVRQTRRVAPDNFDAVLKHEDKAWLTLITCEEYKPLFQTYNYRRMVRTVLVDVVSER